MTINVTGVILHILVYDILRKSTIAKKTNILRLYLDRYQY